MKNSNKIDISKNNVVSGRSLLTSSAKILDSKIKNCRYLEYRTFIDFLESVILHDNVYIIGNFNEKETKASDLMQKLNELNGSEFIHTLNDSKNHFIINNISVDKIFKEILDNTFSNNIQFIRKQLIPENYIYRYNEDEKTKFLETISRISNGDNVNTITDDIQKEIEKLHKKDTNSEFIKHLFRAFEIAAVAKIINGTAKFTGSRKPVGFLIKTKNKEFKFKSKIYRIYHYANTLFLKNQDISKSEYYAPLIFVIFLNKLKQLDYNDPLKLIIELRNEFNSYRDYQSINKTSTKKENDKNDKKLYQTFKFYNEIYRLSSDKYLCNFFKKLFNEIFNKNESINLDYEYSNVEDENDSLTGKINVMLLLKNLAIFINDSYINKTIKKHNKPLTKYFVEALSLKEVKIKNKLFQINEYHKNKMKKFDKFLKKYKI